MSNRSTKAALLAAATLLIGGSTAYLVTRDDNGVAAPTRTPAPLAGTPAPIERGSVSALAQGLDVPWGVVQLPDGRLLVAERGTGRIVQVPAGGGDGTEVAVVPGVDGDAGEGGLLGLAVAPTFADDGFVYAYFTSSSDNRIVRFKLGAKEFQPVLTGIARASNHNGGRIAFGPDGFLYVGTGDASVTRTAQDPASLNGKILRLTPDGKAAPGNPTAGSRVYSLGHRNVQGLAWDKAGRLWATEFGQNAFDEVNLIEPGRNYGWPAVEGNGTSSGGRYAAPKVTWRTSEASPSGAAIVGDTLYVAALRGTKVWAVPLVGSEAGTPRAILTGYGRIRTVVALADGGLLFSTSNRDGRGDPASDDDRLLRYQP